MAGVRHNHVLGEARLPHQENFSFDKVLFFLQPTLTKLWIPAGPRTALSCLMGFWRTQPLCFHFCPFVSFFGFSSDVFVFFFRLNYVQNINLEYHLAKQEKIVHLLMEQNNFVVDFVEKMEITQHPHVQENMIQYGKRKEQKRKKKKEPQLLHTENHQKQPIMTPPLYKIQQLIEMNGMMDFRMQRKKKIYCCVFNLRIHRLEFPHFIPNKTN